MAIGCRRSATCFAKRRSVSRIETGMAIERTAWHWPEYLIEAGAIGAFMVSAEAAISFVLA